MIKTRKLLPFVAAIAAFAALFTATTVSHAAAAQSVTVAEAVLSSETPYLLYDSDKKVCSASNKADSSVANYDVSTGTLTFTKSPGNYINAVSDPNSVKRTYV